MLTGFIWRMSCYFTRFTCFSLNALQKGSRFEGWGPEGDQTSLLLCPQAFASVREASASVRQSRRSVATPLEPPEGHDSCVCRRFWRLACQKLNLKSICGDWQLDNYQERMECPPTGDRFWISSELSSRPKKIRFLQRPWLGF